MPAGTIEETYYYNCTSLPWACEHRARRGAEALGSGCAKTACAV
jgi:hypothetical protein